MSKLAIVLCAILFASAANASFSSDSPEATQNTIKDVIDAAKNLELKLESIITEAAQASDEVYIKTIDFANNVSEEITDVMENVINEIKTSLNKDKDFNDGECIVFYDNLKNASRITINKINTCVQNNVKIAFEYVERINELSDEWLANVTEIVKNAQHCSDHRVISEHEVNSCVNVAANKVSRISNQAEQSATTEMEKLKLLLDILQQTLGNCKHVERSNFDGKSSDVVERTKKCIQRKKDEDHNLTTY